MPETASVQFSSDGYRIRVGDEYSEVGDLGEPIEWAAPNGKLYIALADVAGGVEEGDEVESKLEHWLYECVPVVDAEEEDVESFDEGGDGEGGEDGDGDDEDGEEDEDEVEDGVGA